MGLQDQFTCECVMVLLLEVGHAFWLETMKNPPWLPTMVVIASFLFHHNQPTRGGSYVRVSRCVCMCLC